MKPKRTVDPDRAVALGAAAFAGILEGEVGKSFICHRALDCLVFFVHVQSRPPVCWIKYKAVPSYIA